MALDDCRVIVIGDTPKDIDAAVAIGAECLGVATGHYSVEELSAHGCHRAVANLEAPEAQQLLFGR